MEPKEFLPIEIVFVPNWWHQNYGFDFGPSFYLDHETRIRNGQMMNCHGSRPSHSLR